ncbi:hypothetical protein RSOLAG1IB_06497 [Rhizoctonia solani AG-1 IB]|uniref:DDE-1 domain-containing protein n=1 Tax=Thanatephorus cucumeris (strain AG1-IB / isolate 7/3/14) TaxID=1108050 RepID=A0A0B7FBR1_THACB|nr:hypothetical protein RSOLAG1IB_06497 [Rhizoctonia solani AG-1 IB]
MGSNQSKARSKSQVKKTPRDLEVIESQVTKAINWVEEDPAGRSQRKASKLFQVGLKRLQNRMKGVPPPRIAHARQQLMTPSEEQVAAEFILSLADHGFPITRKDARVYLSSVIRNRRPDYELCPMNFVDRFLKRHPEIRSCFRLSLDRVRAGAANPETVADHFKKFETVSHNVARCNIFNMDEKGGTVGEVNRAKVLVRKSTRPILIQDGNQENVTIVECISADGTAICPTYIFKGKYVLSKWKENDPLKANFTVTDNGWTNTEVCLSWLRDVFDVETREKAAGLPRLLVWDGHVSHMSYEAAVYARENNITLFCLPPHSTALLQPLDKVVFGPLSKALSEEIEKASVTGQPAQKEDFPRLYAAARHVALTSETILKSFEATGLVPFDPDRIDLSTKLPPKINEVELPLHIDRFTEEAAREGDCSVGSASGAGQVYGAAGPNSDSPASGGVSFGEIKELIETPAQTEEGQRYQVALAATYNHLLGSAARETLTHRWANKINIAAHARKDGSQRRIGKGTATILTNDAYIQEKAEKKAKAEEEERAKQDRKKERERKRTLKRIQDDLRKKKKEEQKEERQHQKEQKEQEKAKIKARQSKEREQEATAKEQQAKMRQSRRGGRKGAEAQN